MNRGNPEENRLHRISRNALFSSGGWLVSVVLAIMVTPYMVSRLTLEGYGIYSLVSGLTGYFALLDIGLGQGLVKFVAEHRSTGRFDSISADINTSLVIQTVTGLVGAVVLFLCSKVLIGFLNIPALFIDDTIFCIKIASAGFLFSMLAGTLRSVLMGLQRFDLTSKAGSIISSFSTIAVVVALYYGYGIKSAIIIAAASGIVLLVTYAVMVRRLLPSWAFRPTINRLSSKRLFSFSIYLLIMNISGFITTFFTQFIISHFLGPGAVSYYAVASRITNTAGGVLGNAFSVIFPVFSEIEVTSNRERLKASFYDSSRLFASLSFPLYLVLAASSAPLLTIWMGKQFADKAAIILAALALTCLAGSLTTILNHFLIGTGYTRQRSIVSIVIIMFNLVVMPIATKSEGVLGLVGVQFISSILALTMLLMINKRVHHFLIQEYLQHILSFHLLPFVAISVGAYYFFDVRLDPVIKIVIALAVGVVYLGGMAFTGWLPFKRLVVAMRN